MCCRRFGELLRGSGVSGASGVMGRSDWRLGEEGQRSGGKGKKGLPMNQLQKSKSKCGLLPSWVGVGLLTIGAGGLYFGRHNFWIRAVGLFTIVASAYLVRKSRFQNSPERFEVNCQEEAKRNSTGPSRALWILSLLLVPVLGTTIVLLNLDAANGGHATWPVDLFAGTGIICAVVWGLLVAKLGTVRRDRKSTN
jgi:hypothetical protein